MTVSGLIAELQKMPQDAEVSFPNWVSIDIVVRPEDIEGVVILAHISEDRGSEAWITDMRLPEGM